MKVCLTGLPDGEWAESFRVGDRFIFYNGYISMFDNKQCEVVAVYSCGTKGIVRFENGETTLAYNTELKKNT